MFDSFATIDAIVVFPVPGEPVITIILPWFIFTPPISICCSLFLFPSPLWVWIFRQVRLLFHPFQPRSLFCQLEPLALKRHLRPSSAPPSGPARPTRSRMGRARLVEQRHALFMHRNFSSHKGGINSVRFTASMASPQHFHRVEQLFRPLDGVFA